MRAFGHSSSGTSAADLLAVFFNPNSALANPPKEIDAINTRLDLMSKRKEYAQEAHAVADYGTPRSNRLVACRAHQPTAIAADSSPVQLDVVRVALAIVTASCPRKLSTC